MAHSIQQNSSWIFSATVAADSELEGQGPPRSSSPPFCVDLQLWDMAGVYIYFFSIVVVIITINIIIIIIKKTIKKKSDESKCCSDTGR